MSEKLIKDMQEGEIGYTLPWMVYIFEDKTAGIRPTSPLAKAAQGTSNMKIRMTSGCIEILDVQPLYDFYRLILSGGDQFNPIGKLASKKFMFSKWKLIPVITNGNIQLPTLELPSGD